MSVTRPTITPDTLTGALDQLFGGNAGANAGDDNGPPPTDPGTEEPQSDAEALAALELTEDAERETIRHIAAHFGGAA